MTRRPPPPLHQCYCPHSDTVNGQRIWRCNVCWNGLVDDKNELVRHNNELLAEVERLRGGRGEGSP